MKKIVAIILSLVSIVWAAEYSVHIEEADVNLTIGNEKIVGKKGQIYPMKCEDKVIVTSGDGIASIYKREEKITSIKKIYARGFRHPDNECTGLIAKVKTVIKGLWDTYIVQTKDISVHDPAKGGNIQFPITKDLVFGKNSKGALLVVQEGLLGSHGDIYKLSSGTNVAELTGVPIEYNNTTYIALKITKKNMKNGDTYMISNYPRDKVNENRTDLYKERVTGKIVFR